MRRFHFRAKPPLLGRLRSHQSNSEHNLIATTAETPTVGRKQSIEQCLPQTARSGTNHRKTEAFAAATPYIEKDLCHPGIGRQGIGASAVCLTIREQRILSEVIEAAQHTPGSLRVLAKLDWIYTALHRNGRTRWRIESTFRNLIASGECS